jgi:hypothetical protein
MNTRDLIDMIADENADGANATFDALLNAKLADALDVKKIEVASAMFNGPEAALAETMTNRQLVAAVGADQQAKMSLDKMNKYGVEKLATRDKNNLMKVLPSLLKANQKVLPSSSVRKALKVSE